MKIVIIRLLLSYENVPFSERDLNGRLASLFPCCFCCFSPASLEYFSLFPFPCSLSLSLPLCLDATPFPPIFFNTQIFFYRDLEISKSLFLSPNSRNLLFPEYTCSPSHLTYYAIKELSWDPRVECTGEGYFLNTKLASRELIPVNISRNFGQILLLRRRRRRNSCCCCRSLACISRLPLLASCPDFSNLLHWFHFQ